MPISAIDGCGEAHWSEVFNIIVGSVESAGFEGNLVSNADDVGIIHKRIIQNLYENPMVVCDVSGKNPNVMFELGLRLAFDKPTIIIKDDQTTYSFDTSAIEHLEYPRDLRFSRIIEFKEKLSEKIRATFEKSTKDENYTTFLKHFGKFTVAKIEKKEVSGQEFILDELRSMRSALRRLEMSNVSRESLLFRRHRTPQQLSLSVPKLNRDKREELMVLLLRHPNIGGVDIKSDLNTEMTEINLIVDSDFDEDEILRYANAKVSEFNKKNTDNSKEKNN